MLELRIIHHFLRSSGFLFSWQDLQRLRDISRTMIYKLKGLSGLEALDIAMSLEDIGINHGADKPFIHRALRDACAALKVLGRNTDAALVFEEAAEGCCELEAHETEISKVSL